MAGGTGLVFSLGYLFSPNAPLLYGTESIPMALNTALGFVVLGVGLAAAAGPRAFPLLRLAGPSIRARLLRVFLPLVVGDRRRRRLADPPRPATAGAGLGRALLGRAGHRGDPACSA